MPPRVVGLEWLDPPFAVGHWVPEQIRRAGGWDLLGQAGERSVQTDWLAVAEVDPEMLVLMPCGFHLKRDRRGVGPHAAADRLEGDRGGPAGQRLRGRRLGLLLAARPAGHRRDRDAGRDLRPRRLRRDVAAGRLDAARAERARDGIDDPAARHVRLPLVRPIVDDALARRPRGLGPALPGLPRQGRREPVPAVPAARRDRRPRRGERRRRSRPRQRQRRSRHAPAIDSRWSTTTRRAPASTTTGTSAAAATLAGRSTTPPGTPSSTAPARWLDGLPIRGEIVELAAGTGWWSPLLASKGELSIYDAAPAPLDRARDRLLAHGLRAHIHVRDAWAEPDRPVDALFCGFWLSHVERDRTVEFLALARRWLKPGGRVRVHRLAAGSRSPARPTTRRPPTTRPSAGSTTAGSSRSSRSTASPPSSRPRSATPASRRQRSRRPAGSSSSAARPPEALRGAANDVARRRPIRAVPYSAG